MWSWGDARDLSATTSVQDAKFFFVYRCRATCELQCLLFQCRVDMICVWRQVLPSVSVAQSDRLGKLESRGRPASTFFAIREDCHCQSLMLKSKAPSSRYKSSLTSSISQAPHRSLYRINNRSRDCLDSIYSRPRQNVSLSTNARGS